MSKFHGLGQQIRFQCVGVLRQALAGGGQEGEKGGGETWHRCVLMLALVGTASILDVGARWQVRTCWKLATWLHGPVVMFGSALVYWPRPKTLSLLVWLE